MTKVLTMRLDLLFLFLVLGLASPSSAAKKSAGKDDKDAVKVKVIRKPSPDCKVKTKKWDKIQIQLVASMANGKIFEATNAIYDLVLGRAFYIKGLEEGLFDMCEGEIRKLFIPANKAHGKKGDPTVDIPPDSDLVFQVVLVKIVGSDMPKYEDVDLDKDNRISKEELKDALMIKAQKTDEHLAYTDVMYQEQVFNIFDDEDKNKDGFISFQEFMGPKDKPFVKKSKAKPKTNAKTEL